jgi:dTDP-4-amino-4,6-dideoxygalactose transaminase
MRYPYFSPNIDISDFVKAFFMSGDKSELLLKEYFSKLTGKKYIIITNSCRSALYLAYKAIGNTGDIITSPLTCKVAIDPINESGNKPVFADITLNDLNINPSDIQSRINNNTIAIQAIHLGGNSCDMDNICRIARENNLWVIEDCAQSLGAFHNGFPVGTKGDIACFSLIKNAYSIGGGIFATNSLSIYNEAIELNFSFPKVSFNLIFYRIVRNVIETNRNNKAGRFLYKSLMKLKGCKRNYVTVIGQLYKISILEKKIAAYQIKRYPILHELRKKIGIAYYNKLSEHAVLINNDYEKNNSSFTKFFIYNPKLDIKTDMQIFMRQKIEVMHLENSYGSVYQERLFNPTQSIVQGLTNYNKAHDCLISLPLSESYKEKDVSFIIKSIVSIIKSKE